jgi:hypothetical protein
MDSILIGIFVAVAVWIFLKLRQGGRGKGGLFGNLFKARADPSAQGASHALRKERRMPRIGTPGTVTEVQIKELRRNLFTPSRQWSFEEAALILDAVSYLRAVCSKVIGKRQPALEIQNELLTFILEDQDLRDYVRKWGKDRREMGEKQVELMENQQFQRVAKAAGNLAKGLTAKGR